MELPVRGSSTDGTKLHIEFSELTGIATGGSAILSYTV
jgi:hypothetical protein